MTKETILTLNAGSSSLKFAYYHEATEPDELLRGQVENLGPEACLSYAARGQARTARDIGEADHGRALEQILSTAGDVLGPHRVAGVGHRITHGGALFTAARRIDADVLQRLDELVALAPLHQPHNLAAVRDAMSAFPDAVQIGCFDTAFHQGQPRFRATYAIPRQYYDAGIRRYGFHGLSYSYVAAELARSFPAIARGRVVVAHLGNGASMCAIREGRSVATTMGFTALDGLVMGTRCGQIDPGVLLYMLEQRGMKAGDLSRLLYRESGLIGLSGLSSDMRVLERSRTPEAAEAIACFVERIRRELGSLCAALGGIDGLVFCGGIGENAPAIRAAVCADMDWLGIAVDEDRNLAGQTRIGTGAVDVLVIATDEERVIARAVAEELQRVDSPA